MNMDAYSSRPLGTDGTTASIDAGLRRYMLLGYALTAYDTQRVKAVYFSRGGHENLAKAALMGALTLYLDFINLFVMLLQLMGTRRGR